MDLKSIQCAIIRLKSNEILVKSTVKSTKNLKILKSVHKILKLVTPRDALGDLTALAYRDVIVSPMHRRVVIVFLL